MTTIDTNHFIKNISQLNNVSGEMLNKIEREVLLLDIPWIESYTDYQSSGWKTTSLMSCSGKSDDLIIRDGRAIETENLQYLPTLRNYLKFLSLDYMWVRLAKLEPNSFLWEHKDYVELEEKNRLRFHLPITTNKNSFMIMLGHQIHLGRGYLWKLDPRVTHGACNMGSTARIHLIIDCYVDEQVQMALSNEWLNSKFISQLNELPDKESYEKAKQMAALDFDKTAEKILLKTYHNQLQSEGECYDKIIKMYNELRRQKQMT